MEILLLQISKDLQGNIASEWQNTHASLSEERGVKKDIMGVKKDVMGFC